MSSLITVSEVNNISEDQFEWMFGNVIELCTEAAAIVKTKRPFTSVDELCEAFASYLDEITENEKLMVLKLHPDLAGQLAARGELTRESTAEQRAAGLDRLSAEQVSLIGYRNEKYKAKFGFPFIICARENKVDSIIEGLQQRYNNTRAQEIQTGINEVKKICKLRILDIVKQE
ncbi:2-oxo-4-hydroxy-4-carboxy-5-ureidoimidazoline decarboxylase-like [Cydia splendana]|uniref:2-oxo-4-hydroxy-4-carboxy-5-ureidoimidazoline decarboxylase-like n=1 Tax=Cydia splendana TaxID=1100963 RepID=UPI0028F4707D